MPGIHIEVKKWDGTTEVWMVEGGRPTCLWCCGLTRESLTQGTELIVDGYQTKDHSKSGGTVATSTFTDGRMKFVGFVGYRCAA